MIQPLAGFAIDALVVAGGGLALLVALRLGRAALDVLPMSRARRQLVTRVRPIAGGILILVYVLLAARWLLRDASELAPYALALVAAFVVAASWGALRDVLEGAYLRAARTFAAGDRIQIGTVRGRVQRLGYRHLHVESSDGELVVLPYRAVAEQPIQRSAEDRTSFHVFRLPVPAGLGLAEAKRLVQETALLCHWSSIARSPQVVASATGELDVTVFPIAPDHAGEIERAIRAAVDEDVRRRAEVEPLAGRKSRS